MNEILLALQNASVQYGGVRALENVTTQIDEGEIVALMGPNGAGKSTALKALFGIVPMTEGRVLWHGKKIIPVPYEMSARGITFVPQGRQVFKSLTVYENLELGGYSLPNRRDLKNNIESVLQFFPGLKPKLGVKAGVLSGGQQQMLTIGRGLVADPKVLLLDEPSLGLSPKIVQEVFEKVREINLSRKIAVVIVEHSVKSVLSIAHRAYLMSHGKVIASRNAGEFEGSGELEQAFLASGTMRR
ncbi:MAG TPA: ABC transporter ATP-binding protein [Candidatus Paceibacterota bacterium]|uniref:ABC transporter domain-containing protein n=1 Tax=Candidatus Taylorbacteria bacterium RIFCSPHIGHO2_01_FULL_46_22b TaxID=1802301 RepID=A0A1G2M2F6_9BACT|nr:MAG: hypothetical protein A2664_00025 [Candidatus Taylorbacteria bacterium RIFCSPHIGHO2_01_FULL_46_22b]